MKNSRDPLMIGAGVGAFGAAVAGLLGGLCCAGPLVMAVLGATGAWAAVQLAPYRPYLLGTAGVFLVLGFFRAYRPAAACATGRACSGGAPRRVRVLLWLAAALLLGSIISR
jgi:mercuric ion transport protein